MSKNSRNPIEIVNDKIVDQKHINSQMHNRASEEELANPKPKNKGERRFFREGKTYYQRKRRASDERSSESSESFSYGLHLPIWAVLQLLSGLPCLNEALRQNNSNRQNFNRKKGSNEWNDSSPGHIKPTTNDDYWGKIKKYLKNEKRQRPSESSYNELLNRPKNKSKFNSNTIPIERNGNTQFYNPSVNNSNSFHNMERDKVTEVVAGILNSVKTPNHVTGNATISKGNNNLGNDSSQLFHSMED